MPYSLRLPAQLEAARWKVKIFDREGQESPHVSIVHKTSTCG